MLLSISMNKACTVLKKDFKITHSNLHSGTRSHHLCPVSHSNTHIHGSNLLVLAPSINSSLNKEKSTILKKYQHCYTFTWDVFLPMQHLSNESNNSQSGTDILLFSCYKKHK